MRCSYANEVEQLVNTMRPEKGTTVNVLEWAVGVAWSLFFCSSTNYRITLALALASLKTIKAFVLYLKARMVCDLPTPSLYM